MGSQYEDKKTGDEKIRSVDDSNAAHDSQITDERQTWMKTTTRFLAHWGIETNGYEA